MRYGLRHALPAAVLFLPSTIAHASGDPIVIYFAAGGSAVQLALLVFIWIGRTFRPARLPATAAYVLYLGLLWAWVWESRQSTTIVGAALIVLPCLAVGVLMWVLSMIHRRSQSGM